MNQEPESIAAATSPSPNSANKRRTVASWAGVVGRAVTVSEKPVAAACLAVSGVVKYSDAVRRIIRFEDGRNVSVDENVQLLANGAPVMLSTLTPGTFVVARSSKPLAFRDNTYYVATGTPVVATAPISGPVVRFDQPNLIVLSDGRVIPATPQTVVMVDNRAVPYTTLAPGMRVVVYPNGQAALVQDPIPAAFPWPIYPEAGLREQETERNAP